MNTIYLIALAAGSVLSGLGLAALLDGSSVITALTALTIGTLASGIAIHNLEGCK